MTRAPRRTAPPSQPSSRSSASRSSASRSAESPERPGWRDLPGVVTVTVVPAVVALAAGLCNLGGPPPWRDEAATISAAGRTLPELAHLLQSVDAVHGLYYLVAHVVADLSGTGEVALRLPSVVAGALAAAGTGALGRALGSPRAGLYGGVLLALMPIFSRYVQEARPYSLAAAAAVGATLLLLRLVRSPTSGVLAAYAAALTVLGYLNLFAFLVAAAHGVALILSRGPLLRWACAATPALAAVAPLAWLGSRQSEQVDWISPPDASDVGRLAVELFGDLGGATGPGVAPLTWGLAIFGLAGAAVAGVRGARAARGADEPTARHTPEPPAEAPAHAPGGHGALVRLTLPWLLVPALVLLTISWTGHPVYVFRYVFCCVPAAALLAGAGLAALPPGLAAAVLAAWLGLSVPGQFATRGPDGRQDDPRPVMALLAAEARPGDGVLFVPAKVRKYTMVYPSVFGRLSDVALALSPERDGSFPGRETGPRALAARLDGLRTLWVVGHTGRHTMPARRRALVARSFTPAGHWTFRGLFVARYLPKDRPEPSR
ncbi:glycosyltransferase family 39 protein [Microbispora sp. H11081]|uniref:glycosyltransferase family 39 protein n=1 Tax=Microbispora sp. H11081 TaxID=2729107 RepID=UPI001473CBE8|nr:glycosyltransferase family 39 protein [Microbispora sp. H11081]